MFAGNVRRKCPLDFVVCPDRAGWRRVGDRPEALVGNHPKSRTVQIRDMTAFRWKAIGRPIEQLAADRGGENCDTSKRILRCLTCWRPPKGDLCWF